MTADRRAFARGGVEFGAGHYRWMVVAHAGFLASMLLEVWWFDAPFVPPLAAPMIALVGASMGLRYWVVATLGDRWNTRVVYVPGDPPIASGPFRLMRHPNYLAVIVELLALPLVHGAWFTALCFTAVNAAILKLRIALEEQALAECSNYARVFSDRPRLLPLPRRPNDRDGIE